MRYRVLTVGTDVGMLATRQALLVSRGYDSLIATPEDLDEKLRSANFDLVILSAMLSQKERGQILAELPAGTRPLVLETLVWPNDLLRMVAEALGDNEMTGR
jgi:DNA-binding response OmpR family regulator